MFSSYDADTLLDTIVDFAEAQGYKYVVAKDKFKVKLEILCGEEKVELTAKISKAGVDKYCIEFNRTSGDSMLFFTQFNTIKEYFGDLINATY